MGSSGGSSGGGGGGGMNPLGSVLGFAGSTAQGISTDVMTAIADIMNYQNRQAGLGAIGDIGLTPDQRGAARDQVLNLPNQWIPQLEQNRANAVSNLSDIQQSWSNNANQLVQGMGAQQRTDINTRFNNLGNQAQADLTSRGLSASTLGSGIQGGIERQRSDALGGLQQQLLQNQMNVLGQTTNLKQGVWGANQDLFNQNFGNITNLQQLPFNMAQNDVMRFMNLISGFNNIPPDQSLSFNAAQGLGSLGVNPPSAVQPNLMGPSLVGAGAGLAGTGILAGTLAGAGAGGAGAATAGLGFKAVIFCIDADSNITMSDKRTKKLSDIRKGDMVMSPNGEPDEVIGIDMGEQKALGMHLELFVDQATITISEDHIIDGKAAGELKVGDLIHYDMPRSLAVAPISGIVRSQPPKTGDLLTIRGRGYIANGFPVSSMLSATGVTAEELDAFHAAGQ